MKAYIGIDVAVKKGKYCPISICVKSKGRLVPLALGKETQLPPQGLGNIATLRSESNIAYATAIKDYILSFCSLHKLTPVCIAIDSPLKPRAAHLKRRKAEVELDKRKISCYTTPSQNDFENIVNKAQMHIFAGGKANKLPHSMQIFMLAGFAIADALKDIAPCIEIYPHATAKMLGVAGKHKTKDDQALVQLNAISHYTRWPNSQQEWAQAKNICKGPMHDQVDAYSAAWIASLLSNERVALGAPSNNDAIWIPRLDSLQTKDTAQSYLPFMLAANAKQENSSTEKVLLPGTQSKTEQQKCCPACKQHVFKRWPLGWDAHAAHKCQGLKSQGIESRKLEYKTLFLHLHVETAEWPNQPESVSSWASSESSMSVRSNSFYNERVDEISQQYLSISFGDVHSSWFSHLVTALEKPQSAILDIGAGSGRDVSYIAKLASHYSTENNTHHIVAVEPSNEMLKVGQQTTKGQDVLWLNDALPVLENTSKLQLSFDLILLSAVWMHVSQSNREGAMRKIADLLKPGGDVIISLKFGMTAHEQVERHMYDVSVEEVQRLAENFGMSLTLQTKVQKDKLVRTGVYWQTIILQKP